VYYYPYRNEPDTEDLLKMPRAYYTLFTVLFLFSSMTATGAFASPSASVFNVTLRENAGKSTQAVLNPVQKVVIDAGHGGKDPGGMGNNSHEKHIVLKIAQLLAIGIRTNFPDVEVIMTRADDTFIPLYERAAIANREGADLFISIHANIMPGSSATYGTETFVMGQHVAKHNLAVAKRENASILLEDNVKENYGYDPNSDQGHIMMSMFQHAFLERSILFAELVEGEFSSAGRKSRGVKQAGFVVLKETTMPSVLVETGFMSNSMEETYLLSDVGQQKLANAILKAFSSYYKLMSGRVPVTVSSQPMQARSPIVQVPVVLTPSPVAAARKVSVYDREVTVARGNSAQALGTIVRATPQPIGPRPQWTAKGVSPKPISYVPIPGPATALKPAPVAYGTLVPATTTAPTLPPRSEASRHYESLLSREVTDGLRIQPTVYQQARRSAGPMLARDSIPKKEYKFGDAGARKDPANSDRIDLTTIADAQLTYAVQIIATKRNLDLTEARWQRISNPIRLIKEGGWNKYQVRGLVTATDAETAKIRVEAAGFPNTMIVVYYQGKRLAAAQVNYLLNR
jgi:N-acetylmuramoyl-L-alanine amidase